MKFDIRFIPEDKIDEQKWLVIGIVLAWFVIVVYGIIIGSMLDSDLWAIILTLGVWFVMLLLTNFLSRIKIKRLK